MTEAERGAQKIAKFLGVWFLAVALVAIGFSLPSNSHHRRRGPSKPRHQETALEWLYNPLNPFGAWRTIINP